MNVMACVQAVIKANNMEIKCPHQCFINNEFVESTGGKAFGTVNPNDETVICHVSSAQKEDVVKAVQAAKVGLLVCVCVHLFFVCLFVCLSCLLASASYVLQFCIIL